MVLFDLNKPNYVSLNHALAEIQSGWIAQFRGKAWVSRLIEYGTGGPYSHSGMLRRDSMGSIDLLEMLQCKGGRAVPFEKAAREDSGIVDIYSPDLVHFPEYNGQLAANYMRGLTAKEYGWSGVARLLFQRVPIVWRLWPLSTNDLYMTAQAPFCSHAVATSARLGGGVDPTPNKPDDRTTPNDLSWSLLFNYRYTVRIEEKT